MIKDCNTIICQKAGMNGKYGIEQAGLNLIEESGPLTEILNNYIKHYEFMNTPLKF